MLHIADIIMLRLLFRRSFLTFSIPVAPISILNVPACLNQSHIPLHLILNPIRTAATRFPGPRASPISQPIEHEFMRHIPVLAHVCTVAEMGGQDWVGVY